jgi:hypothetical protein
VGYHSKRPRNDWGENRKTELAVTIIVLAIVLGTLAVFLLVYHDVPLRTP